MPTENSITEILVLHSDKKDEDGVKANVLGVTTSTLSEPVVTMRELLAYYFYYYGGSGVPILYTVTIFQEFATLAGYDPVRGPGSSCLGTQASGKCVLPWGNGTKSVSSIVLLASGISFAVVASILTVIGPAADYGSFGRWPLLVTTLIYWGAMFSTMTLTSPSRWGVAMAIFIIGFICFGLMFAFYAAIFPQLARNTPRMRDVRKRFDEGEMTADKYKREEALEKTKISSLSIGFGSVGFLTLLSLNLALLIPLQDNPKVNNYIILMSTAFGVVTSIWWFIFQQPRPGPKLPKGEHYLTIGWKQIWISLKQYKKLPNTFMFLFAYFLLADGQNTTMSLVLLCQNVRFAFSFKVNTYLAMVQGGSSAVGLVVYWYIQRHWKIDSKKMFITTNIMGVILPLWGMIGIWTDKFGYHNRWEFWGYHIISGLSLAPFYSYSQTVMAELSPPGFDFMFFGLFGMINRASLIVGPNVIQAIIDRTGNTWQGFPFLFAICAAPTLIIWLVVDVPKGRRDAERWAAEQRGTSMQLRQKA